jgi:hypothetical protein
MSKISLSFDDDKTYYITFFKKNFQLYKNYRDCLFVLYGSLTSPKLKIKATNERNQEYNILSVDNDDLSYTEDKITKVEIYKKVDGKDILDLVGDISYRKRGGSKASVKKEVCGKLRCIYKIPGSRKEHLKYKGQLITVADYKKLMKAKSI